MAATLAACCMVALAACSSDSEGYEADDPEAYVLTARTVAAPKLPRTDGYYRIRNAAELRCFIETVGRGAFPDEGCLPDVILEHDIEIDRSYDWVPIGGNYDPEDMPFACDFQGQGHRITGTLVHNRAAGRDAGFFGHIYNGSCTDLTVDADIEINWGGERDGSSAELRIGGLCGSAMLFSAVNCQMNGTIRINTPGSAAACYIGGLCGRCEGSGFSECSMNGAFEVGRLRYETAAVGGICAGAMDQTQFDACTNSADITIEGFACDALYVGGIIATTGYRMPIGTGFRACANHGAIRVSDGELYKTTQPRLDGYANNHIGGIAGLAHELYNDSEFAGMERCVNDAPISARGLAGNTLVGGLCGQLHDGGYTRTPVTDNSNSGAIENRCDWGCTGGCVGWSNAPLYACTNSGAVTGTSERDQYETCGWTGGIAGHAYDSIHDCFNSGAIDGLWSVEYDYVRYTGAIAGYGHNVYDCCRDQGSVCGMRAENPIENFVGWRSLGYQPASTAEYVLHCEESH